MSQLVTPGPVPISKKIRKALSSTHLHHRAREFKDIFQTTQNLLQVPFQTKNHVFIITSSGTGAMEAALVNTMSPQDEVLILVSGKFGQRWAKMAENFDLKTHTLTIPWGKVISPQALLEKLKAHPQIKGVFFQACETSTGVLHDVKSLAHTIKTWNPKTLVCVDASTALTATEILTDTWDLDIVIGSSQKGFQLPAGLSFISFSSLAFEFLETSKLKKFYFCLQREKLANNSQQTAFSPSVSLILALRESLKTLETTVLLNKKIKLTQTLSQATLEFAKDIGLEIFSEVPSPSVSTLKLPENIDGEKIKNRLQEKHKLTVAGGQEHLKGKIIRIGHMGDITKKVCYKTLKSLAESLIYEKYEIKDLNKKLKKVKKNLGIF